MEIKLTNKRVLITGGCGGIAKAIIKKLIACEASVIALDCRADQLNLLESEFKGNIEILCVDLIDWNATRDAIQTMEPIDLLINNAGIAILEAIGSVTEEAVDKQLLLNIKAVINVSQTVAKNWIRDKKKAAIVNISSQSSIRPLRDHLVYCASKGAVDQITRVLALELAPLVRVNAVNPTVVWTELGAKVWADPKASDAMKAGIPMKRFAEPEEVADAVIFLLSDMSSMTTGHCLPVDGGYTES